MEQISLGQIAQVINGTILCGDRDYLIEGVTAIKSAKQNELCFVANCYDVNRLTADVCAVVTIYGLEEYLKRYHVPNIIVVNNIQEASSKLMNKVWN